MPVEEIQEKERTKGLFGEFLKKQGLIILYALQFLLVLMYLETEIQPFVYVRF